MTGEVNDRTGADGKRYAIGFEMRLPLEWNGRFLIRSTAATTGRCCRRPATSRRRSLPAACRRWRADLRSCRRTAAIPATIRPTRRSASPPARPSASIRRPGATTAIRRHDARADRQGDHRRVLWPQARLFLHVRLLEWRTPRDGGGDADARAYDGFLAGDPGFDLPRAAIQHAWDAQAFVKADPDIRKSITADDAALVSRKIIAACDKLDGLEDGLTENLAACQKAFDFDSLICAPGASADCLPKAKVEALKTSFAGPRNSKGEALYSDWPVDGGVGTGNWRLWKIESPIPPWDHYPIIATMGAASLDYIFTTPPTPVAGSTDALMKSLLAFDFDRDAPKIYATTDAFPQSAMEFMTPPDADDPKLAQFRQLARKMIIYHGQADPVFSIDDTIRWYEKLNANLDGKANVDVRLFAVPGMTHCSDGLALDKFDALTALVDWVEKGKAPDRIIATVDPANKEIPASWSPNRTRPLCPWPKYAKYSGGDPESAGSFECSAP